MRVHVAAAGDSDYSAAAIGVFRGLAAADEVGRHVLEPDPAVADVILFVDLQQHLQDPWLRILRRHPLVRTYPERVRVYDERDFPAYTYPGVYVSGRRAFAARRPAVGGPYAAIDHGPVAEACSAPDLLFSFQGSRTYRVRDSVLALRHPRTHVEETSSTVLAGGGQESLEMRSRYLDLIGHSKFVLCPRGHGASSFRIFEVLAAGRVPVIVSDTWLPPPRVDWSKCAVRVRESDVGEIPRLLEQREAVWPELAANVREAFRSEFRRERLWNHFCESLSHLGQPRRITLAPWWTQPGVGRIALRQARHYLSPDPTR